MAATPETLKPQVPETPQVTEYQEEFIIPEKLQQSTGVQFQQKNFKAQVKDNSGKPLIQTPPTQVITITPPSDQGTLTQQAKGSKSLSITWLSSFWLRIIKKALHFGWKIIGKAENY